MKGLTKDNFWNDLQHDFPEAMEIFSEWIDEYKTEIGWNELFRDNIKFHDLPFDMQSGIISRFRLDTEIPDGEYLRMKHAFLQELVAFFQRVQAASNAQNML